MLPGGQHQFIELYPHRMRWRKIPIHRRKRALFLWDSLNVHDLAEHFTVCGNHLFIEYVDRFKDPAVDFLSWLLNADFFV